MPRPWNLSNFSRPSPRGVKYAPEGSVFVPGILFGVSPIGLGHATRSLVVRNMVVRAGVDVEMFSGGKAADYILGEGVPVRYIVSDPAPYVKNNEMSRVALWYVRSWLALRRTVPRTKRLYDEKDPDLVVCDEEFSGYTVAKKLGSKCVFIADELELGFARGSLSTKIERRVEGWYKELQRSVDILIVPETGDSSGNLHRVGPIVRPVTKTKDETIAEHSLPGGPLVLFSMSGSGLGQDLLMKTVRAFKEAGVADAALAISGNRGRRVLADRVYDLGLVRDNQNLVAAADLVISSAGKSTIDEAASSGTPIIPVPIAHHAEQERNAKALGYSPSDSGRLKELIISKIGKREAPRHFNGGEEASRLILSLLR